MIEAIWNIGKYVSEKEKKNGVEDDLVEIYIDRSKLQKTKKILCIVLCESMEDIEYKGIAVEDYSSEKPVLYRPRSPNGPDILPCSIITEPIKTFNKKLLAWFEKYKDLDERFDKIYMTLNENKNLIESELSEVYKSLRVDKKNGIDERTNALLTIKFVENGEEKHLGEDQSFREIFSRLSRERYYLYEEGESRGNGICRLCGQEKELGGYVLASLGFKFATPDKPGFTPNLCRCDYWKSIQICYDCAEIIEWGKRFLDENLSFPKEDNFLGCRYYVIPKFVFGQMFDELYNVIMSGPYKNKDYDEGLLTKEDWIEIEIAKKEDVLSLIFLFYDKDQSRFLIHQYIEDVVPSWLKQIDESQKKIRKMPIFQEEAVKKIFGKDSVGNFVAFRYGNDRGLGRAGNNWYAVFLRSFFNSRDATGNYGDEFRSVIGAILSSKKISREMVITSFVREITDSVRKRKIFDFHTLCIKSFMLLLFLGDLKLIDVSCMGGNKKMEETKEKVGSSRSLLERIDEFFKDYGITGEDRRAAFCVGMLADRVLEVQRKEREKKFGEEPFWEKLHDLRLDESRIKSIYRDSLAKLRQYKRAYQSLEEVVGIHLAAAESKWKSSRDDISYFFALGMTLSKLLIYADNEEKEMWV